MNVEQFEKTGDTPLWVDWYSAAGEKRQLVQEELAIQDARWVPVSLKRDVEYSEMLDGVVESLKHIAEVIHQTQSNSA